MFRRMGTCVPRLLFLLTYLFGLGCAHPVFVGLGSPIVDA
jgi:hypothetical protein